jgi:hypothetical protein
MFIDIGVVECDPPGAWREVTVDDGTKCSRHLAPGREGNEPAKTFVQ